MGMIHLASHIIARAQNNNTGVTNLQLQKVLYFTLINSLKNKIMNEEKLMTIYDMDFLVWRYGPVVEELYEKYNIYGASEIFAPEAQIDEYAFLDDTIDELLKEAPFKLVRESHKHSRWQENEGTINYGRGSVRYSMGDLIDASNKW